jgi:predicted nucleic acid-binding protein
LRYVLDASMALAMLFEDENVAETDAVLDILAESGAVVPSLWRLEVANALRSAVRRQRFDVARAEQALDQLKQLPITVDAETDERAWGPILALSRVEGLSVYDAAYLELALRLDATLMSCDRDLVSRARVRGLTVIAP